MSRPDSELAGRLATRICHDLINPLGALGNGMELLSLSGRAQSDEFVLMGDSLRQAVARTRFFRIAFGQSSVGALIHRAEVVGILNDLYGDSRLSIAWHSADEIDRATAQLVLLAINCFEVALPRGGEIAAHQDGATWTVTATGPEVAATDEGWAVATGTAQADRLPPSQIQFSLLARQAAQTGRPLQYDPARATLSF